MIPRQWWCFENYFGRGWLLDRIVEAEDYRDACTELALMAATKGQDIDDFKVGDEVDRSRGRPGRGVIDPPL